MSVAKFARYATYKDSGVEWLGDSFTLVPMRQRGNAACAAPAARDAARLYGISTETVTAIQPGRVRTFFSVRTQTITSCSPSRSHRKKHAVQTLQYCGQIQSVLFLAPTLQRGSVYLVALAANIREAVPLERHGRHSHAKAWEREMVGTRKAGLGL